MLFKKDNLFTILATIAVCTPYYLTAQSFSFLANSDMQMGDPGTKEPKMGHVSAMIKLIENKELNVKALLIPGDLINGIPSAFNYNKTAAAIKKFFTRKQTNKDIDTINLQLKLFIEEWFNPLNQAFKKRWPEEQTKTRIFLLPGNHESYDFNTNVAIDFIKKQHGDKLYYSFDIDGLHFCSLSAHPDSTINEWLKNDLAAHAGQPTVLFLHYNLRGERSNWISNDDINSFVKVVSPYKNQIKAIINGHNHSSYTTTFDKLEGIPFYGVGGKEFALFTYTPESQQLNATFYKAVKNPAKIGGFIPTVTTVPVNTEKNSTKNDDIKDTLERGWNWKLIRNH